MAAVYTVGHSAHSLERFLELLALHGVQAVADVRSRPYSRHCPHFGRQPLERALRGAGVGYAFAGRDMGGQPDDPALAALPVAARWRAVAARPEFARELDRLERGLAQGLRLCLLCGEEDPTRCHRRLLVGHALMARGHGLRHIRADGRAQQDADLGGCHQHALPGL